MNVDLGPRLLETLENLSDAFFTLDRDWRFTYLNGEAERLLQRGRTQLLGRNIWIEFAPAVGTASDQAYRRAMAEQVTTRFEQYYPPLDRWLNAEAHPTREGLAVYFRDVTEQHRDLEKHQAQMESKCLALLEAAPDAMVLVSQAGEIVLVNKQTETQFGYRRDQLVGQAVTTIIPEPFVERALEGAARIELEGRHQDGTAFPIELMVNPLKTAEGTTVTVAIRDITARKSAEAHLLRTLKELERSNEELSQFAYMASHDLQEPLRMVASYTHLLSKRYKGKLDADADDFIAFAVDGANRMQRLIRDLLLYSRVGTTGTTPQRTSSEDAFNEAVQNLRGAIEESGAQVTHDPLPAVLADDRQLVQLFQNLIGNAIKYQSAGIPRVHVSSVDDGGTACMFSVKDNGLGIESKYFEKIFGMFQRLHGREEFAGTGIGLAICKKIVERHGGSLSVESQPGHGSTFRFALARNEGTT